MLFNKKKFENVAIPCIVKQKWQKTEGRTFLWTWDTEGIQYNSTSFPHQTVAWFFSSPWPVNHKLFPHFSYSRLLRSSCFPARYIERGGHQSKESTKQQNKAKGWGIWDRNYPPQGLTTEIHLDRWSLSSLYRRNWNVYITHEEKRMQRILEIGIDVFSYFIF